MTLREFNITSLAVLAAGLLPWLLACDYTTHYSSLPEPPPAISTSPAVSPTPSSPVPRVTVEPVALDRPAQVLAAPSRPRPPTDSGPGIPPAPEADPAPILLAGEPDPSRYYRSGFACTGSMRPAIDCGDEGVFQSRPSRNPSWWGM